METQDRSEITRRCFISRTGLVAGGAALGLMGGRLAADGEAPYGPFTVGIQTYSLRNFDRDEMLRLTQGLGLHFIESYSAHIAPTADAALIADHKRVLAAHEIEMPTLWADLTTEDAANRVILDFAKVMGVRTVTGAPNAEAVASLDRLLDDYDLNVAIHNHGPGTEYATMDDIARALDGHHERIGLCNDTAWFMASDEDAVEACERFADRLFSVHLKDMTSDKQMTEIGKGALDVVGLFETLLDINFVGQVALEYEEYPENPIPQIEECLAATRQAISEAV